MMAPARRKINESQGATAEEIRSHVRARLQALLAAVAADRARVRSGAR